MAARARLVAALQPLGLDAVTQPLEILRNSQVKASMPAIAGDVVQYRESDRVDPRDVARILGRGAGEPIALPQPIKWRSLRVMDLWFALFFVFSGYLVPLDFFPPWLRDVAARACPVGPDEVRATVWLRDEGRREPGLRQAHRRHQGRASRRTGMDIQ